MRLSKKFSVFLLGIGLVLLSIYVPVSALAATQERIYIIYDTKTKFGNDVPLVDSLAEYMGHFSFDCQIISVNEWKQGMLAGAKTVIYIGLDPDTVLPEAIMKEIALVPKVIWFKYGIEQLASILQWGDFSILGNSKEMTQVQYNDGSFYAWVDAYLAQPGAQATILGTVRQGSYQVPLLWQRGNVYYMGMCDVYGGFILLWAHIFHDIFDQGHRDEGQKVLFRIEDVGPLAEADVVEKLIKTVEEQNIPFAISVIPVGIDGDLTRYLHENKALVAVLQKAQRNGASIIMHGYTHQNEYSPKAGEGYEFWNARDSKLMEDEEDFSRKRIAAGIEELLYCDLVPVAFEAPHYAAGQKTYKVLSEFFNVYSGQIQMTDKTSDIVMFLPYATYSKRLNGMLVIPEAMGFYNGQPDSIEAMLSTAKEISAVPGAMTTMFYHWYMPVDGVEKLVQGLRNQQYMFLNLRSLPIKVQAPGIRILGQDGDIDIYIAPEVESRWQEKPQRLGIGIGSIIRGQAVLLVAIVAVFIGIIIKLKRNSKKLYES